MFLTQRFKNCSLTWKRPDIKYSVKPLKDLKRCLEILTRFRRSSLFDCTTCVRWVFSFCGNKELCWGSDRVSRPHVGVSLMDTQQSTSPPGRVYFSVGGLTWQSCLWRMMVSDGGGSGRQTDEGEHPATRPRLYLWWGGGVEVQVCVVGPFIHHRGDLDNNTEKNPQSAHWMKCLLHLARWGMCPEKTRCDSHPFCCSPLEKPGEKGFSFLCLIIQCKKHICFALLNVEINELLKKYVRTQSGFLRCCAEKKAQHIIYLNLALLRQCLTPHMKD